MYFINVGEKLRALRERLDIEQKELEEAGITRNFISMVENGKRNIGKETAQSLAAFFSKKGGELGIDINIDESYFLNEPKDDAYVFCSSRLLQDLSESEIEELSQVAAEYNLDNVSPKIQMKKADLLFRNLEYSEAFCCYYNAVEGFLKVHDMEKLPYIYNQLGKCRAKKLDSKEAISYFEKAYESAIVYGDMQIERFSLYNLARATDASGNYDKALNYIDRFLNLFDVNEYPKEYLMGGIVKGTCYLNNKEYRKAINIYSELLNHISDESYSLLGFIYNNLGKSYFGMGVLQKAKDYFEKSEQFRELHDRPTLHRTLIDKVRVFLEQEREYDKAIELLNKAISLALQYKDNEYMLKGYKLLEKVYAILKDNEHLEEVYIKMLEQLDAEYNEVEILKVRMKLSVLNYDSGRNDKGRELLTSVIDNI